MKTRLEQAHYTSGSQRENCLRRLTVSEDSFGCHNSRGAVNVVGRNQDGAKHPTMQGLPSQERTVWLTVSNVSSTTVGKPSTTQTKYIEKLQSGFPSWPSGKDSMLSVQGSWV